MKQNLALITTLLLAAAANLQAADTPARKPNILLLLADDLGYADLSCQGVLVDIKTPRIDSLAMNGVHCTAGYVTAPQCSPSRAGIMSGRYQQRFGHDINPQFPLTMLKCGPTMASLFKDAGYATGHFGKWHLGWASAEETPEEFRGKTLPTQHGFDESFGFHEYRIAAETDPDIKASAHAYDDRVWARKANGFFSRHQDQPWFVFVGFHAPHTQLVDFGKFDEQFPDDPVDRKSLLAVMAQEDFAVGMMLDQLTELGLDQNTLIIYLSDNGGIRLPTMESDEKGYRCSLNLPYSGRKGTALEGGIRTPMFVQWKAHLPAGKVYDRPISSLDVLPTTMAAAGLELPSEVAFDGVNVLPFLKGQRDVDPHDALFWRWRGQRESAIRQGDWKLVRSTQHGGTGSWQLIDLATDMKEENDLTEQHPELAKRLLERWEQWEATLPPRGDSHKDTTEANDNDKPDVETGGKTNRNSSLQK